jgi:hypothetical protein
MASSYSTDLKLELMVTGEKAGLWGDITNTNLNILQQAISGREAVSVNATDAVTLAFTNAALSNGKNAVIDITGTPSADATVNVPDGIEKVYIVKNTTGGTSTITIKTTSGTGVTFADSEKTTKIVYSDGTNVVDTGLTDLSSDYSPQLSAALDTNGNDIIVDDAGAIEDDSNNPYVRFQKTASAVNYIDVTNQATGSGPAIDAVGSDSNIDLNISPKGIGRVVLGAGKIEQVAEKVTTEATAATGTVNYDVLTQAVWNFTTDASGNWTLNIRGDGSNSLNSIMDTGESITIAHIVKQGGTAYYNSAVQIDGSGVTPEWQGGSAPSEGNASSLDTYTYTIIKTADATFTVLAAQTQFA